MRKRNPNPRIPAAVGVSFQNGGKVYFFEPNGIAVDPGEHVLAKTDRGVDIGEVVLLKHKLDAKDDEKALKPLLRRATRDDLLREDILRRRARAALRVCEQRVEEHSLPMKLISADYTFDGQRLIFYFSSETRVDFRALVRDLAEIFACRIELRQIGVRDEAKMIGGLGPCGRPLCCAQWLRNFAPVGIRVAKDQGMSLNPAKISGVCDRLMCCLLYEHAVYTDLADRMPRVGDEVRGQGMVGKVRQVSLLRERVTLSVDTEETRETIEVPAADLRRSKGYWRFLGTLSVKEPPTELATAPAAAEKAPEERPADQRPARPARPAPRSERRGERPARREEPEATEQPATVTMREPRRSSGPQAPAAQPEQAAAPAEGAPEQEPRSKSRRRPARRSRQASPEGARTQGQPQADKPQPKPEQAGDATGAGTSDEARKPTRRSRPRRRPAGTRDRQAGEETGKSAGAPDKPAADKTAAPKPAGEGQSAGESGQQPRSRRRSWRRRPGKGGSGDSGSSDAGAGSQGQSE